MWNVDVILLLVKAIVVDIVVGVGMVFTWRIVFFGGHCGGCVGGGHAVLEARKAGGVDRRRR